MFTVKERNIRPFEMVQDKEQSFFDSWSLRRFPLLLNHGGQNIISDPFVLTDGMCRSMLILNRALKYDSQYEGD